MELQKPETVTQHAATVCIKNIGGDKAVARIGGTYFHDGQGDVLARLVLRGNEASYVVYRDSLEGDHYLSEYLVPPTSLGPLTLGNRYGVSINRNAKTLAFVVQGLDDSVFYEDSYTSNAAVVPTDNPKRFLDVSSWMTVGSTTPTFDWDVIPEAQYYRIRIYNVYNNSIYRAYTNAPPYQLPPGILMPGGLYEFRVDSYRGHQWFETDNKAGSNHDLARFWVTASDKPQAPYLDLGSWKGVKTWTSPREGTLLSPWIEVFDAQGVPENIASVKLVFPDGVTERPLYFVKQNNACSGEYGTNYFGEFPNGEYTFVVEDKDGHVSQATEAFTANPLPAMAPEGLKPAQDAIITGESFDIAWSPVNGAVMYDLKVYDQEGDVLLSERTAHPTTQISVPSSLFQPGKRYSYKIRAMDGFYEDQYQNESAPDWSIFNRSFVLGPATSGSAQPVLDLNGWGAVQSQVKKRDGNGTFHRLEFWLKIQDSDGVPENIQSVKVEHPDFGQKALSLFQSSSESEGYYYGLQQYEEAKNVPEGNFTFRVIDHDNQEDVVQDALSMRSVGIPECSAPAENSKQSLQPDFQWDQSVNATWYKVRLYSGWQSSVFWSPKLKTTAYSIPFEDRLEPEGLYQFRIYAYHEDPDADEIDNYSMSMDQPGMMPYFWTQSGLFSVHDGWNLIALQKAPVLSETASFFSPIADDLVSIWSWENNNWAVYLPGMTEEEFGAYLIDKGFQALSAVSCGQGYWVNAETAQTLEVNGSMPQNTSLLFSPGWNLLGHKETTPVQVGDLVQESTEEITSIWKWANSNWSVCLPQEEDNGTSYAGSKGFGFLEQVEPGEGFWVNCQ